MSDHKKNSMSHFDLWRSAINCRLLFDDPLQAEPLLRCPVADMSRISDATVQEDIYQRLNDFCKETTDYGLKFMVKAYRRASEAFKDKELWQGRRSGTRRDFALKLFLTAYFPQNNMLAEGALDDLKGRDDDDELLARFLPRAGSEGGEQIDIVFTTLLAWDVVRPYTEKRHKPDDKAEQTRNMIALLMRLQTLLNSRVGILEESPIIADHITSLLRDLENDVQHSAAQFWNILDEICETLRGGDSPSDLSDLGMVSLPFDMPGLWVDDSDLGRSRFWVVPDNFRMIFCYEFNGSRMKLTPYELILNYISDVAYGTLVTPLANELLLKSGRTPIAEFVSFDFKFGNVPKGYADAMHLSPDSPTRPDWFDWSAFLRLHPGDVRYHKFMDLIHYYYIESEMLRTEDLRNDYRWMSDCINTLVAVDREYIYIWDRPAEGQFRLLPVGDEEDHFVYGCDTSLVPPGLLGVKPDKEHPLYLIPRTAEGFANADLLMCQRGITVEEQELYRRFKDAAQNTGINDMISIYRIGRKQADRLTRLCFNNYSVTVDFDRALTHYGIRRYASLKELI